MLLTSFRWCLSRLGLFHSLPLISLITLQILSSGVITDEALVAAGHNDDDVSVEDLRVSRRGSDTVFQSTLLLDHT